MLIKKWVQNHFELPQTHAAALAHTYAYAAAKRLTAIQSAVAGANQLPQAFASQKGFFNPSAVASSAPGGAFFGAPKGQPYYSPGPMSAASDALGYLTQNHNSSLRAGARRPEMPPRASPQRGENLLPIRNPGLRFAPPGLDYCAPLGLWADGNLLSDSLWSYTWSAENRLLLMESKLVFAARRGEFYLFHGEIHGPSEAVWESLRMVPAETIQTLSASGVVILGPGCPKWFSGSQDLRPAATVLGRLALDRPGAASASRLEPIHLRATQFVKSPPPRQYS